MNKEKNELIPGLPGGFEDLWNKKLSLKKKLIEIHTQIDKIVKLTYSTPGHGHA